MPLIKGLLRKGIRFHDVHDRAPVDHECCFGNVFGCTGSEHFIKPSKIPVRAFFLALASRKRKGSVAVDPFLIMRIIRKFFVILVFKFSKITLCKKRHDPLLSLWKQDRGSFPTAFQRTYKQSLYCRISKFLQ